MSISDDINRLRDIASSERIPIATLVALQRSLMDINAEVISILGENLVSTLGIGATAASAGSALQATIAAFQEYESAIHDSADRLEQAAG